MGRSAGRLEDLVIDHLIYGARDLNVAVDDLDQRFGVRAVAGGKHVGIGTHNALLSLGDRTYLEVIAPDLEQPTPAQPRPFGLDDLTEPQLVGWAINCEDIDAAISRSRSAGYDPGDAVDMTRTTLDGALLRWRLTLNAVNGGPVPFLISWRDGQHPAVSSPQGLLLRSFTIEHSDPDACSAILNALGADVEVTQSAASGFVVEIQGPAGAGVL